MSMAHTPNRIGLLPKSDMSDREALGDGEEARVATDGDLACRSIVNIDPDRGLAPSQPVIVSGRVLVFGEIEGEKVFVSTNLRFPKKETESAMTPKKVI